MEVQKADEQDEARIERAMRKEAWKGPRRKRKPLQFDQYKHMIYNPHWHYRHQHEMSVAELAYIVQSYKRGNVKSLALDIGRTCRTVRTSVRKVREEGLWNTYLAIDTSKFLELLEQEEKEFLERTGFHAITDEPDNI